jgi:hypothetical protein
MGSMAIRTDGYTLWVLGRFRAGLLSLNGSMRRSVWCGITWRRSRSRPIGRRRGDGGNAAGGGDSGVVLKAVGPYRFDTRAFLTWVLMETKGEGRAGIRARALMNRAPPGSAGSLRRTFREALSGCVRRTPAPADGADPTGDARVRARGRRSDGSRPPEAHPGWGMSWNLTRRPRRASSSVISPARHDPDHALLPALTSRLLEQRAAAAGPTHENARPPGHARVRLEGETLMPGRGASRSASRLKRTGSRKSRSNRWRSRTSRTGEDPAPEPKRPETSTRGQARAAFTISRMTEPPGPRASRAGGRDHRRAGVHFAAEGTGQRSFARSPRSFI